MRRQSAAVQGTGGDKVHQVSEQGHSSGIEHFCLHGTKRHPCKHDFVALSNYFLLIQMEINHRELSRTLNLVASRIQRQQEHGALLPGGARPLPCLEDATMGGCQVSKQ